MTIWRAATNEWAGFTPGLPRLPYLRGARGVRRHRTADRPENRRAVVTAGTCRPSRVERPPGPGSSQAIPRRPPADTPVPGPPAQASPPTATAPTVALPHAWRSGREEARRLPDSTPRRPAGVFQEGPVAADRCLRRSPDRDRDDRRRHRRPRPRAARSSSSSVPSDLPPPTTSEARTGSPGRPRATAPGWSRSTAPTPRGRASRQPPQGANVMIYLGHGNGWPSPYRPFEATNKDGVRSQRRAPGTGTRTRSTSARRTWRSWRSRRTPWSCSTGCATRRATTSGAPAIRPARPRSSASTTTGRASSRRGAQAVFASGITNVGYVLKGLFTGPKTMTMAALFWTDPTRTVSFKFGFDLEPDVRRPGADGPVQGPSLLPVGGRPARPHRGRLAQRLIASRSIADTRTAPAARPAPS